MVVENDVEFLFEGKLLAKQLKEVKHSLLVGGGTLHEQGAIHLRADSPKDSHPISSCLVQRPLDGEVLGCPFLAASHPHVEGGLVEVHDGLVVDDHACQAE